VTTAVATFLDTEGPRVEPGKPDARSHESDTMAESGKNGMCHENDFNRRILKTVCPVVWEGSGAQSSVPDPITVHR
jgi:hypothetical protein